MTPHTMTSMVSAATFVVLAAVIALAPVPFVSWTPGRTVDLAGENTENQPMVTLGGLPTTPLNGELRMTTVSVTQTSLSDDFSAAADVLRWVNWGDGSAVEAWTGPVTASHVYANAGVYTPQVVLKDEAGNTRTSSFDVVVTRKQAGKH